MPCNTAKRVATLDLGVGFRGWLGSGYGCGGEPRDIDRLETGSDRWRSVTKSQNRPQRERLPRFKAGISVVKKVKPTVVTGAGERFVFSEGEGVE